MNKRWTFAEDLLYVAIEYDLMLTGVITELGIRGLSKRSEWIGNQVVKFGFPKRSVRSIRQRRNVRMYQTLLQMYNIDKDEALPIANEMLTRLYSFYKEEYDGPKKDKLILLHKFSIKNVNTGEGNG